jgi:DNA repair exonuclease SbcCD ATPase subunit
MALSKIDKRKFIESILNLEVFSVMLSRTREEYNEKRRQYEVHYGQSNIVQQSLKFNEQQLESYNETIKQRIANINEKEIVVKAKIEQIQSKIDTIKPGDLTALEKKHSECWTKTEELREAETVCRQKQMNVSANINTLNEQLQAALYENLVKCPVCGSKITEEHREHVTQQIDSLKAKITTATAEFDSCKAEIKKTATAIEKQTIKCKELSVKIEAHKQVGMLVEKVEEYKQNLVEYASEIRLIKAESNQQLTEKIAEQTAQLVSLNEQVTTLNNELRVLEVVKFVISEEGVKSYIVKKILRVLNSRLAFYLKELQTNCLCMFNEYFEEQIVDERGELKSYFNFSGGEKKRIDLACLFAFLDIRRMQGDVNFSTIFYDELLDSSLDDRGVALTLQILRNRQRELNESWYIITHRGTAITSKSDNVVWLEKRNGCTYIGSCT